MSGLSFCNLRQRQHLNFQRCVEATRMAYKAEQSAIYSTVQK